MSAPLSGSDASRVEIVEETMPLRRRLPFHKRRKSADRFHVIVRRIGACLDSFRRKEGLRAKDP